MSGIINSLTAPIGVKLFSGGPYPDKGQGDIANKQAVVLGQYGQNLANYAYGQDGSTPGKLPGLGDMGVLGSVPGVWQQMADIQGVQNPLASQASQAPTNTGPYAFNGVAPASDNGGAQGGGKSFAGIAPVPGGLQGSYVAQYNSIKAQVEHQKSNAKSQLLSQLAVRGEANSPVAQAALAYLDQQFDEHLSTQLASLQDTQRQGQMQTLQQFTSMLGQLYGDQNQRQQSLGQTGFGLMGQQLNQTNLAAQQAMQQTQQANQALMGAIGTGLGAAGVGAPKDNSAQLMQMVQQMMDQRGAAPYQGLGAADLIGGQPVGGAPDPMGNWQNLYDNTQVG